MNQYYADNRYRRYPFDLDATLPFGDNVLVDFVAVLATAFDLFGSPSNGVRLATVTRSGGSATLTFTIAATALSGYRLVGTISEAAADDTRVMLALVDGSSVAHPELGYGWAIIGSPAALSSLGSSTSLSATISRSALRLMVANDALILRVANRTRPGPSTCAETAGAAETLTLQGRTATSVADCVETTTAPSEDLTQRRMSPDVRGATTVQVAIPSPASTHTRYADGVVTTITTHLATIDDAIPALPGGYDADVDGGIVASTRRLTAGHNLVLTGSWAENRVRFGYRLNAGLGVDCTTVRGYGALGRLTKDCVKSLNGVCAATGAIDLVAGAGVGLLPDQAGHRILVLINAENVTRAAS